MNPPKSYLRWEISDPQVSKRRAVGHMADKHREAQIECDRISLLGSKLEMLIMLFAIKSKLGLKTMKPADWLEKWLKQG